MFKRIVQTSGFAGVGAALVLTLIQAIWVSPLIIEAETYEHATVSQHDAHGTGDHHHEEAGWAPEDGWQRMASTVAANLVVGVAFGLLLVGAVSFRPPGKISNGALWGLAGYAVFVLAPSSGLPPELPGTEAADLHARQVWWVGTAIATAAGLSLLAFSPRLWFKVVGGGLLAVPHLVGAPQLVAARMLAPTSLHHEFVAATLIADALFWVTLGLLSALLLRRFSSTKTLTTPHQEYA